MNKNILPITIAVIVIACIGVLYYASTNSAKTDDLSINATSTPTGVQNDNGTTPGVYTPPEPSSPLVVTISTVTTSDTTAIVNGTVNPRGAFANYWYEYGTTNTLGSKTLNQNIGSGYVAMRAPSYITNLTKNTTYYFRLVAENQYGKVNGSIQTFRTTQGTPAPVGTIPTIKTLSATNVARTTAEINASINPNKAVTQYWFEYGKTTQFGNTSAVSTTNDGNTQITIVTSLADLAPLTKYYYRINAQNQFGTVNGATMSFTTRGPAEVVVSAPVPTTKNATAIGTSSATFNGVVKPNGAETKYWFEYSNESILGSIIPNVTDQVTLNSSNNTATVKANVSSLNSKTTYYFRLVAQNSEGVVRGDTITFKTK